MSSITPQEKLSALSQLIELAKIDGEIERNEVGFIKQIGNLMGISDEEITNLFHQPVKYDPPTSAGERILQFQRMVLLMNVDGDVNPAENEHLLHTGVLLGLNPNAVREVLQKINDYPDSMIPPDDLIRIYMKYEN